jgi:hypothetical protein
MISFGHCIRLKSHYPYSCRTKEKGLAKIFTNACILQAWDLAALWVLLPTVCHKECLSGFIG